MATRRFIAGAQCPRCGQTDTVYVIRSETRMTRRCTRCDLDESVDLNGADSNADADSDSKGWSPIRFDPD